MTKRIALLDWSPLSLANQHVSGSAAYTLDYVPGTALRGALAARY